MKVYDLIKIINETPLPDGGEDFAPEQKEFDPVVFKKQVSYAKRMAYVKDRAKQIGTGSSRTAFEIIYKGRPTVLKVAKNVKGASQNDAEANILDDHYVTQLGMTIPLIDYDKDNNPPAWIHMERATKATEKQLCKIMKCGTLRYLASAVKDNSGQRSTWTYNEVINELRRQFKYSDDDIETFEEYVSSLTDLVANFDLIADDFTRAANWGLFDGKPVVIDVGFTKDVQTSHYSRR